MSCAAMWKAMRRLSGRQRVAEFLPVADSLDQIAAELPCSAADLEALEQRLTVLEQKLIAIARSRAIRTAGTAKRVRTSKNNCDRGAAR